jgi:ectoine hydroxylase-related dioxygenase (phytanoyl-CoA dioxygenase family)
MTRLLTPAQRAAYERDGYIAPLDCLTTDRTRAMRESLDAFERDSGMSAAEIVFKGHLAFTWSHALARDPAILDAVEDLIGPNILVFASKFWIKGGRDGAFVSWHQDSAYFGIEPVELASVWVALTDSNAENGCVRAIPGSHKGPVLRHVERKGDGNLLARGQRIEEFDDSGAVDFTLKEGQFSVHDVHLVHGSLPNGSGAPRIGLSFFYIPPHVRSTVGRRAADLVRGVDEYGHWDQDPAPRFDGDPLILDYAGGAHRDYTREDVTQEAEASR